MGMFIKPSDLAPFATIDQAKAEMMIEDAEAVAVMLAPCLPDLLAPAPGETVADTARRGAKLSAAKAILRGALLRWDEAGTGALSARQETVGPFGQMLSMDTRQTRKAMFWPSEIEQLQGICAGPATAFSIDTAPALASAHEPWCSATFGASCSCRVAVAGRPIHEGG